MVKHRYITLRPALTLLIYLACSVNSFAQYAINGNATQDNCNCYTLTPNALTNVGSVWNVNLIDLTNSFDFSFDVFLGCSDGGADGMAFGLQPVSTSVGINGNGMGLGTISPSLGVYLDTYQNTMPDSDPWEDHISINANGDVDHLSVNNLDGPVNISSTNSNVEDCAWHSLQIIWTYNSPTSQTIEAFFDGVLRVTYTGDLINSVFMGNPNVFWGFTASTGGLSNEHKVCTALNANFGTNITEQSACANTSISFADSSSSFGSIVNWEWDFGDGSPIVSGVNTTSHIYSSDGNYTAELTITDNSGCKDSIEIPITIASPQVNATTDNYSVCSGESAQLDAIITSTPQDCQITQSVSGNDNNFTSNLISAFPCVPAGGVITSINIDANIGANCPQWYYYNIYVNGNLEFNNQCNQTNLDLSAYLPITSIEMVSEDAPSDGISDFVTLDLTVNITYTTNPTYNYLWTPNLGTLNDSLLSNPVATPTSATTYTVLISDPLNPSCQAADTVNININQPPSISNLITTCNQSNYTVSFDVSGGTGGPYTVTEVAPGGIGGSWTGNTWTSNEIASGVPYEFNIDDTNSCGPVVVNGIKDCGCETFAGTMDATPLNLCENETAIAIHNNDSILDDDDNFIFILHDSSSTNIGTIYATNTIPNFNFFSQNLSLETTYYISAIAGNDDLLGGINYTDTCLSVSAGTPVVWHSIPYAFSQNPLPYCEDIGGSGSASGIDLTTWNTAVDTGNGNTIDWYMDSTLTTLVNSPTNTTVTNNLQFYALVSNGSCSDTATILFSVLSLPTAINQTPNAFCEDISGSGSVAGIDLTSYNNLINGGTSNNVNWYSDSNLANLTLSPTNITVSNLESFYALVDNGTCSDTASITFSVNSIPNSNAGINDTICNSLSYTLNATASLGSGLWSGGPTGTTFSPNNNSPNATVTVPFAGSYSFTWTETSFNCIDADTVNITFSNLSISADSTQADCGQANGSITINTNGGVPPYQYSIDGGSTFQPTNTFNNLLSNTYNLVVIDNANCQITHSESVTNATLFTANIINVTDVLCNSYANGSIEANGSDPTLNYSYQWNTIPIQNTSIATNLDTGSYYCIITDIATGCFDTVSASISQPDSVNISINNVSEDTVCINGSSIITALASSGVGSGYIYTWSGPNTNTTSTIDSISVSPTSTSTYIVSATDNNGCPSNTVNTTIYIHPPLTVLATSHNNNICPEELTDLGTVGPYGGNGGPYSFSWDNGIGSGQSQQVFPTITTTYTVTVNDGCSPSASDSITIIVNPKPIVSFTGDKLFDCESPDGFQVNFTNTTNPNMVDSAYWIFSGILSTDTNYFNIDSITYSTAGLYDVSLVVTSPFGCVGQADSLSYINVFSLPEVDFSSTPNPVSMFNPTVDFTDESYYDIKNWYWNFDGLGNSTAFNPTFTFPSDTGKYWVSLTVTDQNNCVDSVKKLITIKGEYSMFVPNAFTPNGDFINEEFSPKGYGIDENGYSFSVYNRWGEKLFETNELSTGWKGDYNGEIVPLGTYIWKLTYYDMDGIRHFEIGSVTIQY